MDVNDDAGCLNAHVVLAFFASKLAPTGECVQLRPGRPPRFYPRMNTGTRPAEGAGGSRSRAAGELTLGLLSGEERGCTPTCFALLFCGSELARDGRQRWRGLSECPWCPGVFREQACSYRGTRSIAIRPAGRPPRFCFGFWSSCPFERPSAGSAQWATRHGCRVSRVRPWMADRSGPTEQDRSEGMPSLGEAPNVRGKSPWLLGAGRRSAFPS